MLIIDDNKLKLAKMQETLLERTINDRKTNIEQYKKTVTEIDSYAFSNLLEEVNQLQEHTKTLEEELQFLEEIRDTYQQLNELQLGFKQVYGLYRNDHLELSDLSQLNIEYIENRINAISGYLINQKNIETNKNKLQELNEQLIEEEKCHTFLSKRLLEMENSLRDNFLNAEGRTIEEGKLQYISIRSEYSHLGIDLRTLLSSTKDLNSLLSDINDELIEIEEKLKTAEICYNSMPNSESRQILDDIKKEHLKIKYKLTMLKILKLLSQNNDDYDLFKEKREQLLDLIKYRATCISKLGIHFSIDPFTRIKIEEQMNNLSTLTDNYKVINKIKKEIANLSTRYEEMINQKETYQKELSDTKDLLYNRDDIKREEPQVEEELPIVWDEADYFTKAVAILDNQVIDIRPVPDHLNMGIVIQKTSGVIQRVNEMLTHIMPIEEKITEDSSPKLVIVPSKEMESPATELPKNNDLFDDEPMAFEEIESEDLQEDIFPKEDAPNEEQQEQEETIEPAEEPTITVPTPEANEPSSIFETVIPFVEPPLFTERSDNSLVTATSQVFPIDESLQPIVETTQDSNQEEEITKLQDIDKEQTEVETQETPPIEDNNDELEELPEAFWTTQEDNDSGRKDDVVPTFDEQINALLSTENDVKTRKLVA